MKFSAQPSVTLSSHDTDGKVTTFKPNCHGNKTST